MRRPVSRWFPDDPSVYLSALKRTRSGMMLACIAVCRHAKVDPSDANLIRARGTLMLWARGRYLEFGAFDTLTDCLAAVVSAARALGTPFIEMRVNESKLWPAFTTVYSGGTPVPWSTVDSLFAKRCEELWRWYDDIQ